MSRRGALLLAALALAAEPAWAAEPPGGTGGQPETATVGIHDMAVSPVDLVVAPGAKIVWTNVGRRRHTVTADTGSFDSGTLFPGDTFSVVAPMSVGAFEYHCRFHQYIRGTVTVSRVNLHAPAEVAYGHTAALDGVVPGADAGTQLTIERLVAGVWTPLVTAVVDAAGTFRATTPPLISRARLRASIGGSLSPTVFVGARPMVSARRVGRSVEARVAPARAGLEVRLERLDLDTYVWRPVGAARLDARGRARLTTRGGGVYRVRLPRGGPGVDGGASAAVAVRG
jgi:plastocyanin